MKRYIFLLLLSLTIPIFTIACESGNDVGDAVEDVGEGTTDAVEEAGETVEESVE